MAANWGSVLDQLRAAGLLVDAPEVGRLTRCYVEGRRREKCGWYSLHEVVAQNGDRLIVGSYGVWTGADNNAQKIELRKTEFSADQREAIRQRMAEDRKRADRLRAKSADKAAKAAQAAWKKCLPDGDSDYLARKGLGSGGNLGVRYSPAGALVIPVLDTSAVIHGLQVIHRADAKRHTDKEFWPAGVAKKGHFHLIGSPGSVVLLAEGFATGASLHLATGLPVAIAFDAGNLMPVAAALRKRYKLAKLLFCADDDQAQKCRHCRGRVWLADGPDCQHCGKPHEARNAGIETASNAALAHDGAWVAPQFEDAAGVRSAWTEQGRKTSDWNDLHLASGLHLVRIQIEAKLLELGWRTERRAPAHHTQGGGEGRPLRPVDNLEELLERYTLIYAKNGMVFDHQEHCLLSLEDMRNACLTRELHRAWAEHPERSIERIEAVGFDPSESDQGIRCNLWSGWPTTPKAGPHAKLLELLWHMCSADPNPGPLYHWVLRWLAYPLQHPGAKMKTCLVIHGPQGTGKNLFYETVMKIYGRYGAVIGQAQLEDKHNDWASQKLFLIADEVIARSDLYHVKNALKSFITGDSIRINPKHVAAYEEGNHANIVFLSNETMPVVLEEDDRRHAVIWTPGKLDKDFYAAVRAEIAAGGVAGLHDYLLGINLDGFDEGTEPPETEARRELIDLSLDSTSRFFYELVRGDLDGITLCPALSSDVYEAYKTWCARTGMARHAPMPKLINALTRRHGVMHDRERYYTETSQTAKGPHGVLFLGPADADGRINPPTQPESKSRADWIGGCIRSFRAGLEEYRGVGNAS